MNSEVINLTNASFMATPFRHFCVQAVLPIDVCNALYQWLNNTDEWNLTQADFYEQFEFSLFDAMIPSQLKRIIDPSALEKVQKVFCGHFNLTSCELVGVTAHKLVNGQHIGIHNDFINGEETHRLVVQLNPNWTEENGGLLMLFSSDKPEDVCRIIRPLDNSAVGFEISARSYHAVSTIYQFSRYTLVYTFKAQ